MAQVCPTCGKPVPGPQDDPSYPFCSSRCRLVDLGNWLAEPYRIPGENVEPPPADTREDEE